MNATAATPLDTVIVPKGVQEYQYGNFTIRVISNRDVTAGDWAPAVKRCVRAIQRKKEEKGELENAT